MQAVFHNAASDTPSLPTQWNKYESSWHSICQMKQEHLCNISACYIETEMQIHPMMSELISTPPILLQCRQGLADRTIGHVMPRH